jgi:hypothetical protein
MLCDEVGVDDLIFLDVEDIVVKGATILLCGCC